MFGEEIGKSLSGMLGGERGKSINFLNEKEKVDIGAVLGDMLENYIFRTMEDTGEILIWQDSGYMGGARSNFRDDTKKPRKRTQK